MVSNIETHSIVNTYIATVGLSSLFTLVNLKDELTTTQDFVKLYILSMFLRCFVFLSLSKPNVYGDVYLDLD